jgi:replicative DNA helicase
MVQMSDNGKIPPQAIDLERSILGALIVDNSAVDEVMQIIKSASVFYKQQHIYVFEAISDLYLKNQPIDILTVSDKLTSLGLLDKVGGEFFVIELTQGIGSSAHAEFHSRIIVQRWIKRQLIKTANEASALCYDERSDVFDIENFIETKLDAIREGYTSGKNVLTMAQASAKVVERVEVLCNLVDGSITGVPTGFSRLDKVTGGWQDSDLIIIAGRPGMGKSALCSATISACAVKNMPVGVISLEMSTQQLVTRLMANNSNFHLNQLFRHGFEKHKISEYMPKLLNLRDRLSDWPVYFEDTPSLDIRAVKAKARLWKRKHGIKLLIVDYLQLIQDSTKNVREQEISISQQLKAIAKELQIPVIALSQLSRAVETRGGDKIPQLSDLRESGAIEQDADLIAFLWRPGYYDIDVPEHLQAVGGNTGLMIKKHRNGSLDDIALYFDDNKTKFSDPLSDSYTPVNNDDDTVFDA